MLRDKYTRLLALLRTISGYTVYIAPHAGKEIKPPFIMIDFKGDGQPQNYTTGQSELTDIEFLIHISSAEVKPDSTTSKEDAILDLADSIETLLSTTFIRVEDVTKKSANEINNRAIYVQSIQGSF